MRLIATAAGTGGRFTVFEQVTPAGLGPPRHIHSREDEIVYISRALTSCISAMSVAPFPLAPAQSCRAAFDTAFATWRPRPAECCALSEVPGPNLVSSARPLSAGHFR